MDKSKIVILLDNGHGKNTPGKRSNQLENGSRLYEWSYVREIVKLICDDLEKDGIAYHLIHPEEEEFKSQGYDLMLRTSRANTYYATLKSQGKTAIFISVHVNAAGNGSWNNASGWQVHIAKTASANSLKLGQLLYDEASKNGLKGNRSVPKEKVWRNDFWVLRKTNMPAVLTENLFMTNKEEVAYLLSEKGKQTIAKVHIEAIKNYIKNV